ncbi:MAG: IS30 family transposase [Proteobacteria bacterium]|nr:IS30 family transposase [Pseudomonadota bacterium]
MGCYRHLTRDDREEIAALRAAGHSMRAVAATVGKAPSSISRELKRNALDSGRYAAHVADGAYLLRRQRSALLERDKRLARFVRDRLMEGWSPQQISGWLQSGTELGLRAVAMGEARAPLVRATGQRSTPSSIATARKPSSSGVTSPAVTSAGANPRPGGPATRSRTGSRSMSGRKRSTTGPR